MKCTTFSSLVYLLMGLLFIVAFPIAKLLDCLLGDEHTTFFRRAELKVLVDMHGPNPDLEENEDEVDNRLSIDEVLIIKVNNLAIFFNLCFYTLH